MKEKNFFIMKAVYTNFAHAVELGGEKKINECPKCGAIETIRLEPIKVYFKGKKQGDYYDVPGGSILGKKMQELLINERITGFKLENINVDGWYDSSGKILPREYDDLKELKIIGRCGYLRHKSGDILEKCDECGYFNYDRAEDEVDGLSVDLNEWDGSDMFQFKNWPGVIIVTETVKEIVEKNKLKNIKFTNISEFRFD